MNISSDNTLSQIVTENYQAARVFEKYGLDFCCKGKRPLVEACTEKGISPEALIAELEASIATPEQGKDFNGYSLSELAGYIVRVHHTYVKLNGPQTFSYVTRVAAKHGDRFPYMKEVYELFAEVLEEMGTHMEKEELVLFPRIKQLELSEAINVPLEYLGAPIDVMEAEHEHAGDLLARIRQLTNDYTAPAGACTTHGLALSSLQAFEQDLHQHVHLENNILFPKTLVLHRQRTALA
jgi:regulator of cell morphogenesis and NO signaling